MKRLICRHNNPSRREGRSLAAGFLSSGATFGAANCRLEESSSSIPSAFVLMALWHET